MHRYGALSENLIFLIHEVQAQLARTEDYLRVPSEVLMHAMDTRDDYIDNLRTFVQREALNHAVGSKGFVFATAASVIAANLERIADFCIDVIGQYQRISAPGALTSDELIGQLKLVREGLSEVEPATLDLDVHGALEVCKSEPRLDETYAKSFNRLLQEIEQGHAVHSNVTQILICHYFERMGDSLLNIGEAIISASLGEKIKIDQLWALQGSLNEVDPEQTITRVSLKIPAESRSGCRIATVSDKEKDSVWMVFKEGSPRKLADEKRGIELWESLVPGVAPSIRSYVDDGPSTAMLIEHLPGQTFEHILINGASSDLTRALDQVIHTVAWVWDETRKDRPTSSRFIGQLRDRLPDVLRVHPGFTRQFTSIGGRGALSLEQCLERGTRLDDGLVAPFAVLLHGDFNVDNIIPSSEHHHARLIDLHRARLGDYLQDASVFLVSNYRLQAFTEPLRRRINSVILRFSEFLREYGHEHGDTLLEARLALGLARSFATSTRFILDENFAKNLFLRAEYLVGQLIQTPELETFRLKKEVLVD